MKNHKTIPLFIGTIILSTIVFYNGYPLVYSDTGTYIFSGFDSFIPNDRPIIYGLFLKFFSFKFSTWLVVFTQNMLTAFVILETIKLFNLKNYLVNRTYYFSLLFLVLFTGVGWYSNQLMPDFLAPLSILIVFILLTRKKVLDIPGIVLVATLLLSLTSHFSHLLICSFIVILLISTKLIFANLLKPISLQRIWLVSLLIIAGWLILPTINYTLERKFILSKGSHVFLMAHLNDTGILEKFLNENCENPDFKNCKLCEIKDSLPNNLADFIWDGNTLEKTGGWIDSKEEYKKIIYATLTSHKYLLQNIYRSATYGFIQLTKNEIGQGLSAYNEESAPYGQIHWRFHDELNNYLNSKQNKWNGNDLNFEKINLIHLIILISSLFILFFLFASPALISSIDNNTKKFIVFIILSIIISAFITAGLSSPCERFQARVVWLIPFSIIILFVKNFKIIIKSLKISN